MNSVPKAFLYCSPPVLNSHLKRNQSNKTKSNQWIEDVSFYRNCGAVSVGGYNRVIWYYQLIWKRKLTTVKSFKADVSSSSRWPMYVFKSVNNIKLAKDNQFLHYFQSFVLINRWDNLRVLFYGTRLKTALSISPETKLSLFSQDELIFSKVLQKDLFHLFCSNSCSEITQN